MISKLSVALFAGLAAIASAQDGFDVSRNQFSRPLTEVVPACKPFPVAWNPTNLPSTVTLVLLKGPSPDKLVPIGNIATSIQNTGSFSWTPESTLEFSNGASGYGIKIVTDSDQKFQYSNNFGISKGDCAAASSSKPASSSGYPVSTPSQSKTSVSSVYPTGSVNSTSTYCSTTTAYVAPSGTGAANSTVIQPTKSMSVPETLKTSATGAPSGTGSTPPQSTGAAAGLKAGLGLAGAVAGLVLLL